MFGCGALGQPVMVEGQSLLSQGAFLLPASVSHGLGEVLRSIRSSREARQAVR
jgi:hypothetical protein